MIAQRLDVGRRLGTSKAQMPDEALCRSQLQPGTNIWFEYLPNWDIKIHSSASGGTAEEGNRFLVATFQLTERPPDVVGWNYWKIIGALSGTGNSSYKRYFGTEYYLNIRHNWDLATPHHYLATISSIRQLPITGVKKYGETQPRIIGIDVNTIMVQGTIKPTNTLQPKLEGSHEWVDMTKTVLLEDVDLDPDTTNPAYYCNEDTYIIRLQEIPDPFTVMYGLDSTVDLTAIVS